MDLGAVVLRNNAERIASAAVDAAGGVALEGAIRSLVFALIQNMESPEPLDTSGLKAAGAQGAQILQILRAIEHQCIDILWAENRALPHRQCVIGLRDRLRRSLGRPRLAPDTINFYQALLDGESETTAAQPQRLHAVFEGVMSAVRDVVYICDFSGNILYLNRRGLALTKYTRDDLLDGLTIADFVVPRYMDVVDDHLQAVVSPPQTPFTVEIFAKDGERIPVEIGSRVLSERGRPTAVIGVARDLRLERRIEDEMRRANASLEGIMAVAPMGIMITDDKGRVREVSPAAVALCGAPDAAALLGQGVETFVEHTDRDVRAVLRHVLRHGEPIRGRAQFKTRFGGRMHCDFTVAPLCGQASMPGGLLILCLDVAEQMALQQSLLQVEKLSALGEIVGGVAHELNNPLTGILGYAQLLQKHSPDFPLRSRLGRIEEEAQRCKRIVHSLLSFAQRQPSVKSRQDINKILRETIEFREYQLSVDNVELNLCFAKDLPEIEVDAQAFQRVFLNLINNAHQALLTMVERPRTLAISTRLVGQSIHVAFVDNGPGIAEPDRGKVFDPFFSTKPPGEATGLGLSICYGIVGEHGGSILLDTRQGEGATFTVVLPVQIQRHSRHPRKGHPAP